MSWSNDRRDAFLTLLDRVCDQRATEEDYAAVERIVREVPEAKALYVAYLDLHGTLLWDAAEGRLLPANIAGPSPVIAPVKSDARKQSRRRKRLVITGAVACAALVVGIVVGRFGFAPQDVPEVVQADPAPESVDPPPEPRTPRVRQPVELAHQPPTVPEVTPELAPPPVQAVVTDVVGPPPRARDDIAGVSDRIDALLRRNWDDLKLTPSPRADDAEWCRRIYLDIAGRIPTVKEVETFLADDRLDKRRLLADDLLESVDYARNQATIWSNLLVGRSPAPQVNRESLQKFLRMSFAANKPWNELVAAMLSAEGRVDENGAANFLVAHLNNDAMPATAVTSELFFGTQLRCAQCHNHPFTDLKQAAFWELNSLFQQTEVVNSRQQRMPDEERRGPAVAALVSRPDGGPIYYETPGGLMKVAFPRFGGHDIDATSGVNRRQTLAALLTSEDQPQLAGAFVNRLWAHFFGAGFTRPIDDFGAHNPPSQPELFALLRDEFVRSGYDVKQLVRWITATEAYQLTSRPQPGNQQDDLATSDAPAFSRVYPRPMSPEQLFDSLVTATQAQQGNATDWTAAEARRQKWLDEFIVSLDNDENEEEETLTGTYAQALAVMNGELVQQALDLDPGTFLGDLARAKLPEQEKIRRLCLAALSRPPTPKELPAMQRVLHDAGLPRRPNTTKSVATPGGYQDLFWALLNANEFAIVH